MLKTSLSQGAKAQESQPGLEAARGCPAVITQPAGSARSWAVRSPGASSSAQALLRRSHGQAARLSPPLPPAPPVRPRPEARLPARLRRWLRAMARSPPALTLTKEQDTRLQLCILLLGSRLPAFHLRSKPSPPRQGLPALRMRRAGDVIGQRVAIGPREPIGRSVPGRLRGRVRKLSATPSAFVAAGTAATRLAGAC